MAKKETPTFFRPDYSELMDSVEKKFHQNQGNLSLEAKATSVFSTGLLNSDLMLGGGIFPGTWMTVFGGEGSAKSTHLSHFRIAAAETGIPVIGDWDYEGSSQADYIEGIMEYYGKLKKATDLYGLKDGKGNWVIPPRLRYYQPATSEEFFDPVSALLRRMPDKEFIDNKWFYVWDADKAGRAASEGKHSKVLFSKYGKLYVEAENGLPQALFFVDSYPAMYPGKLDEDDSKSGMAAVARSMSENIPKVLPKLRAKAATILGANQLRLRPGFNMGDPSYEPGGEAVKFASGVRVRQTARSVPPPGKGPFEFEDSVLVDGSQDKYRYIHMRTIKNKITGNAGFEAWQRVWAADPDGNAHGFDPVFDTYEYLRSTGQIDGPKKKLVITIDDMTLPPIKWLDFKAMVLFKGTDLKEYCGELGIKVNPKLRERCFAQLKDGTAHQLYYDNLKTGEVAGPQKDEIDDDAFDDEDEE